MTSLKTSLLFVLTLFAAAIIAQPSNDNCVDAIPIIVGQECTTADYTSIAATAEDVSVAANPSCGFYQGGDVWFTFTVPASGNFRIELDGNEWALYSGTCGGFTEIRCEGNNHNFREPSLAGQTLYLRAFRWNNDQGADFSVCIWEFDPQPNDYCADAINLPVGQDCTLQDFTTLYTTSESTDIAENPTCGFYNGGDVWFTFTAPASGNFRIELAGNEWALYSGTCGDFTEIRCEGNNHNFREPSLAGQTLYLRAFRWNNDQGADFSVCVWEFDPQPNDYCADAINIPVGPDCTLQNFSSLYTTSESTDVAENPTCGFYDGGDVWFTFTVPASGDFRVNLDGNQWELYSGTCGNFTQIRCDGGAHNFRQPDLAGQTLYLRAFRWNNDQGSDFELCVWEPEMQPNDYCADAINIEVGQICTEQDFSSQYATAETEDIAPNPTCGFYSGGDVWFTFTVPASGDFRVELDDNEWELYSGSCGDFTQIGCYSGDWNFSDPTLGGETIYLRSFRWNNKQGAEFSLCIWEIDVPENNLCSNATNIILNDSCATQSFSSRYATAEDASIAGNPGCGFYSGGDVWFTFTAPESGQFALEKTANTNGGSTQFAFYTGSCGDFEEFHCAGSSEISFNDPTLGGELITVRAFSWNNRQGADFDICIKNTTIAPNDMCANATPLNVGESCTFETFNNFNTTSEEGIAPDPTCGFYSGGDVWFTFEVPSTGQFQINRNNISGGSYNYAIYTGTCGAFELYDCSTDPTQSLYDAIELANQTVYLRVYRWNSSYGGEFELCVVAGDCSGELGGTSYVDECGNCVGGNTGLEPCVQDCNGVYGGTAYIDNCETCVGGNTGLTACEADCHGDFGGTAYLDNCEICVGGETGVEPCTQDCNGDFGGTAYLDNCDTCVGGNTGIEPCETDCNGVYGGTAYLDNCGICVGGTTELAPCTADCNGDYGGTAYLDNCDTCVGGNTELDPCTQDCNGDFGGTAYLDNCQICVGGNTALDPCTEDCNGDFGGTAYLDNCETCVGGNTELDPCEADCNGDFGGTAYLDNCDTCVGGNTELDPCEADCNGDFGGTAYLDNCETCVGGNTELEPCTADCNGDFGGNAYLDNCETCVGGNTELDPCNADCNGDFGGTAYLDNCETCVGGHTELEPCEADCNGDFGGTAYLDNCETCVGGNTELEPCEADCNGDFGGTAYLDNCETCVGGNTALDPCEADCNGDFGGTAYLDNCETCVGGNTELDPCKADCNGDFGGTAYLDNCETCVGGNTELDPCEADCNGDFGGTAYLDNCETCVGGNTALDPCEADCNGDFGGTAYLDNCETCVGGNTELDPCEADCNGDFGGTAYLDNCDTCVGGNTELDPCEADCNGDFGGTAFIDDCGVCAGGNTGVTPCSYDCPELESNYGDPCDDGNPETTIDMINFDCECQGIIIYDCPNLEANIGDSCDDGDAATTNDMITADCGCEGTIVNPTVCQEFVYYLADYTAQTGTSIYEVHLNGGIAELTFLTQIPDEVHLAYNNEHNLIYAVSKLNNSYYTLNPHVDSPVFTGPVYLSGNYGQITGAAFSEDDDLLIASQNTNKVFSINVMDNSGSVYDEYAPIRGGDIAFNSNGVLFLASSTAGGGLYEVHPQSESSDILLGELSNLNTGLAITDSDELLLSERNSSSLAVYTTSGSSAGGYDLMLDGEVFTLNYGDMASGCNTYEEPNPGDCSDFSTFFAQYDAGQHETTVYGVTFSGSDANLTAIVTVADEMHIAFRAELNTLFLISKTGSYFREYALYSDDLSAETQLNLSLHSITAADFNEVDGLLYIADANSDMVYSVDTETGFTSSYMSADVNGGDLAILQDGTLYLATQSGNSLYDLNSDVSPVIIGGIPSKVTGLARANSASSLIISNYKSNVFVELSANDASTITAYSAKLNGEPFMLMYGDMASGCIDVQRAVIALQADKSEEFIQTSEKTMLSSHPNPTSGASEVLFTTAHTLRTLVEVYDMNGRNVATLFDENAQKGKEYRLDFNGEALPNGVYIYRLTNNQETIIEKFMIAR